MAPPQIDARSRCFSNTAKSFEIFYCTCSRQLVARNVGRRADQIRRHRANNRHIADRVKPPVALGGVQIRPYMTQSGPLAIDFVVVHHNAVSKRVVKGGNLAKGSKHGAARVYFTQSLRIAVYFAVIIPADVAHAQPKKPTAPEETLAAKIKCRNFQKLRWEMDEQSEYGNWDNGL
jgi:hypothetical protein